MFGYYVNLKLEINCRGKNLATTVEYSRGIFCSSFNLESILKSKGVFGTTLGSFLIVRNFNSSICSFTNMWWKCPGKCDKLEFGIARIANGEPNTY